MLNCTIRAYFDAFAVH